MCLRIFFNFLPKQMIQPRGRRKNALKLRQLNAQLVALAGDTNLLQAGQLAEPQIENCIRLNLR